MATPNTPNGVEQLLNFSEQVGTRPAEANPVKRAIDILFRSQSTWLVVAEERGGLKEALIPYTILIGLVPMLIGSAVVSTVFGVFLTMMGNPGEAMSLPGHLFATCMTFLYGVAGTLILAKIVEFAAPSFGLRKSWVLSTRVLVYAATPTSLVALVSWIPLLGSLMAMAATAWSFVLAYRGFKIVLAPLPAKPVEISIPAVESQKTDERELANV